MDPSESADLPRGHVGYVREFGEQPLREANEADLMVWSLRLELTPTAVDPVLIDVNPVSHAANIEHACAEF